ncbi:fibrobacter succinogenes major paralogous domain-containing protein [candidate division KSB1 bacterium]
MKRFIIVLTLFLFVMCDNGPTGPEEQVETYEIAEVTKILESSTAENIVSVSEDGTTMIFPANDPTVQNLAINDVLVANIADKLPNGLLRKVASKTTQGDQITITTTKANMEEVFEKASINAEKRLTVADISTESMNSLQKGVSIDLNKSSVDGIYIAIDNIVLYDVDGDLVTTTNDQIRASGGLTIDPSFEFDIEIDDNKLQELSFVNTVVETAELKIYLGDQFTSIQKEYDVATLWFDPYVIWIGWVPIVIVPKLALTVGIEGSTSAQLTAGVTQNATLKSGLDYSNGSWDAISDFSKEFTYVTPSISGDCNIKAYTGPQFNLMLYGVAGPYVDLNGYLEFDADVDQSPWWELYGGAEVGVGIEVDILGKEIVNYYKPKVIDYRQLITQVQEIPPPTGTVTDIDGNVYETIIIGNQEWMVTNLKVTKYRNGDAIPKVSATGYSSWTRLSTDAYCKNYSILAHPEYGHLYNWYAVDDSRGLAPAGWHVPTDDDWKELEMFLGMSQTDADGGGYRGTDEGGKLKETGTSHWSNPNTGASNGSGFTALPGGFRSYVNGYFGFPDRYAYFWSSTEASSSSAWFRRLYYKNADVMRNSHDKREGCSVRCVRDK